MNNETTAIAELFGLIRLLREKVSATAALELSRTEPLRGEQTQDAREAMQVVFSQLQDQIDAMEQTVVTIAEATGVVRKL